MILLIIVNKFKEIAVFSLVFLVLAMLIINPYVAKKSALEGLSLCGTILIPSLFPFTVISIFISKSGLLNLLYLPKKIMPYKKLLIIFLISAIGGYPVGAKIISEEYKNGDLNYKNANLLLHCCINGGPSFIILTVGSGILRSLAAGIILYISNILASIIIFLTLKNRFDLSNNNKQTPQKCNLTENFVNSVAASSSAMISVCAYVVIASTLIGIIKSSELNEYIKLVFIALTEISNAVINFKNLYLLSALLGFSGISIIFQIIATTSKFSPSFLKIIISRVSHAILSVIITFLILKIFPITIPTISNIAPNNFAADSSSGVLTVMLILTSIIFLYSVNKKNYCGKLNIDIF